ncbi:MAG: ABC transporter substrate-binding protein [Reyranellaceae bacterium]
MRAVGALMLAACVALPAAAQPKHGGTINMLIHPEPTSLVAIATTAGPSVLVSAKILEGLLTYDFALNPKPQLAQSWSVSPDGKVYTFKLRQGVKWHDGRDFTSADVAYSVLLLKEIHPHGRGIFSTVQEVKTPDAHTAEIVLSAPAPYLIHSLAGSESPIVPKHIYEGKRFDTNPANIAPIGTGPFLFKEWVRGSHIVYERNPNYWDKPKPYVDRLIVRFYPDAGGRVAAIETGNIDLAPMTPVSVNELNRLRALPNIRFDDNGYQYFNYFARLEFNLERDQLKDPKVRHAIAHAIDRQAILRLAWFGYGKMMDGPITPTLAMFHTKDVSTYPFDPKKAEQLLDEAGYKRGANGVRFKMNIEYIPNALGDTYKRTAEIIKQYLANVGIELTIRSSDFSAYLKRVYTDRDFDMMINNMAVMFDPTIGIQRLYWSKNIKRGVPFSNGAAYANPEVDTIFEEAATEGDVAKRKELFVRLQQIITRDLPDLTLMELQHVTIYNPKVKNHTVTADGVNGNLAEMYIESK